MTTAPTGNDTAPGISRARLFAMAAATGVAVANIYYNQPMLGVIKAEFAGDTAAAMIPTATQLGYAIGLFFLVPLGDLTNRRRLITGQFLVLAGALALASLAPTALTLVFASMAVGITATVAQHIVPFAAALAAPERRAAAVSVVMSGLFTGVLLSRTVAGFVGAHLGWREMFALAIPLALLASVAMRATLPSQGPASTLPYHRAMWSLTHYWRAEPTLRVAVAVQAAVFASYVGFWTVLTLLLATPAFDLGADAAGMFGLLGIIGVFITPLIGRTVDAKGPDTLIWCGVALLVVAWVALELWVALPGLIIAAILLELAMRAVLIPNQAMIYGLDPAARSRLNTIFMTGMFLGGSLGSAVAIFAWNHGGWTAVCGTGIVFALLAVTARALGRRRRPPATV